MRNFKSSVISRIRFRTRVLTTAALSTLASAGLSRAAVLLPGTSPQVPEGSIGYLGPIPQNPLTTATGNTFSVAVIGFDVTNSSSGFVVNDAAYLLAPAAPKFGTTKTVTGATQDGETETITSSETVKSGVTTDKVTVSVPSRFIPVGDTFSDGDVINEEDLEIGFDAGTPALTFSVPVTSPITASGTAKLFYSGGSHTYTFNAANDSAPYTSLDSTDTMLSADEGLDNFTDATAYTAADLTAYNLSSFSFTFSYATPVPEPTTAALGLALGAAGLLRRRARTKSSPIVDLSSGVVDEPMLSSVTGDGIASHVVDNATGV